MALKTSIWTYAAWLPPDQLTVRPLARVAGTGLAASGRGLVRAGMAGIEMVAEKAGTSAPPGALTV